jgi:hypothetical protein
MAPTNQELAAARELGEALARYIAAVGAGRSLGGEKSAFIRPQDAVHRFSSPEAPSALLVSPREAAKLLCVSEKTLWSHTMPRGPIPVVRLGKSVRYSVKALANFISTLEGSAR